MKVKDVKTNLFELLSVFEAVCNDDRNIRYSSHRKDNIQKARETIALSMTALDYYEENKEVDDDNAAGDDE